jgi:hypothetical protein
LTALAISALARPEISTSPNLMCLISETDTIQKPILSAEERAKIAETLVTTQIELQKAMEAAKAEWEKAEVKLQIENAFKEAHVQENINKALESVSKELEKAKKEFDQLKAEYEKTKKEKAKSATK